MLLSQTTALPPSMGFQKIRRETTKCPRRTIHQQPLKRLSGYSQRWNASLPGWMTAPMMHRQTRVVGQMPSLRLAPARQWTENREYFY